MPAPHRSSARDRACHVDDRPHGWTYRVVMTAACAAAASALLVGCGSSSPSGSSTGTGAPTSSGTPSGSNTGTASGTPAVCTQAGEFKAALSQVTSLNVIQQGTNAVKAAADNVQTQFDALKQTASSQYQSQVNALESAVSNFENVVGNLGSQPSLGQAAQQVISAAGQVSTAAQALYDAISSSCPGGIPSVSAAPLSASPS